MALPGFELRRGGRGGKTFFVDFQFSYSAITVYKNNGPAVDMQAYGKLSKMKLSSILLALKNQLEVSALLREILIFKYDLKLERGQCPSAQ